MKLRKLTAEEAAQLCQCGLRPGEWGHDHTCPYYVAGRRAALHCGQRTYALALLLSTARRGRQKGTS
jgi:hypothetical protein